MKRIDPRIVTVIIIDEGVRKLFLSTISPAKIQMYCAWYEEAPINQTDSSKMLYLPYMAYNIRWNIEVSYLEQKSHWSLASYMVRSRHGIEMQINLINIAYAGMKILPYKDPDYEYLKGESTQEVRFVLGQAIRDEVFFANLLRSAQIDLNSPTGQTLLSGKRRMAFAA